MTDIKHHKSRVRPDEQHKENSPWNFAMDFDVDVSFSADSIKGMLDDYEKDHNVGMDTADNAGLIRDYTDEYSFLVSRICKLIDKDVCGLLGGMKEAWTHRGMD